MTLEQIEESGELNGYRTRPANEIDAEVCSEMKCDSCGHKGLLCFGFESERSLSYRAFAACPDCKEAFEI